MANLINKNILVYDLSGSYTFVAEHVAKDFGKVFYFTNWQSGFSTSKDFLPGLGLPDVERVADFFKTLDKVDMLLFADVGHGDLQEFLRKEGYPVFGCGDAQSLEIDRAVLHLALRQAGISTPLGRIIRGIEDLEKILKKEKDLYIKFSFFRGDFETFHHKSWFSSETWLHNVGVTLGPYGDIAEFLVEDPIEGESIEIGADLYAVDGKIPENYLCGYEIKDAAFVGHTDGAPSRLAKNTEQFAEILKAYEYRGIFSTEVKITNDDEYLIDATCRLPSPPSELECAIMENFSEVIWEGAHGRLIEPEYKARFGAELILKSDWAIEHALPVQIEQPDSIFLHGHFKVDGKDFCVVPEEFSECGAAVGIGSSLEDAIGLCIEAAESTDAHQLRYDIHAFTEAIETIKKGESLGVEWTGARKLKSA